MRKVFSRMSLLVAVTLLTAGAMWAVTGNSNANTPVNVKVDLKGGIDAITIPQLINYQGKLTDVAGNPITAPQSVDFKFWDDPSAGNLLWYENQTVTPDANGVFNVLLGSNTSIPGSAVLQNGNCYLEVTVGGVTITPRTRLVSVPYAYKADTANYALGALGAGDNDWEHGGDSVLYTIRQLGISRGGSGNVLYGTNRFTHVNLGTASTTGAAGQDYSYCTVAGGDGNTASGDYATVGGGYYNEASGLEAVVGGGYENTAHGDRAVLGGGTGSSAYGFCATVGGGQGNNAGESYATVAGGRGNGAGALGATVGGGESNAASYDHATVGGGYRNEASGEYATVGGGIDNHATGNYATIAGGQQGTAAEGAALGGGNYNTVLGTEATVGGGHNNAASSGGCTVGGGGFNTASGDYSTVPGGREANATLWGQLAYASGKFVSPGDAQTSLFVMRRDAPWIAWWELFLDGSSSRLTIPAGRLMTFDILVAGSVVAGYGSAYRIVGAIRNVAGTVSFLGTPTVTVLGEDNAAFDIQVTADNANQSLKIEGYAPYSSAFWVATVRTAEAAW